MNKKVVVLARQRHGSQRVQRSCAKRDSARETLVLYRKRAWRPPRQRLRSNGITGNWITTDCAWHDAQHDRENLKSNYNQEFSEQLNDLKRLKWTADSFLNLD